MKILSQGLLSTLSMASFAILFAAIWWLTQYDRYRTVVTVVAFMDTVPFALGLIWFTMMYHRSPTSVGRAIINALAIMSFFILPAAVYWGAQYDRHDRARILPIVIAAIDIVPFVAGMMWFASSHKQIPKNNEDQAKNSLDIPYYAIPFVVVILFLQYIIHRYK